MRPDRHVLMSIITFTGLVGKDYRGVGLQLDQSVCTNRFEGTDISLFDKGGLRQRRTDQGGHQLVLVQLHPRVPLLHL